nr:hypothetical protein [Tanacetum cinerariifolium]
MATTINQHIVLDESLVPSKQRLRIGRSNFRLPLDIQSKESTLQVVYDILRNSPLFRAFQVTADVPEIYMHDFWAMAELHHNSIHFKIDTRKSFLDLEAFREMLHISPRIPNQDFADFPTDEEILEFLRINIDFAYLIWEDFVYQVEHKNQKRSNKMNYPRFTKVIIDYFMTRKPSISRQNRINWHYVRDDALFSTIKVAAPKPKASTRKKKGDSASSTTPPTPTPTTTVESALRLDPIDIKMDIIHPEPDTVVTFRTVAIVRTLAQHREAIQGIQENLIKTMEAIEEITRKCERQARVKIEKQLAAVQESQHQD